MIDDGINPLEKRILLILSNKIVDNTDVNDKESYCVLLVLL